MWVEGIKEPGRPVLSLKGTAFVPLELLVVAGQTVDMPNESDAAHSVVSLSEARRFNLGIYGPGETRSVLFTQPGVVETRCSIHKQMRARIVVVPTSYRAQTNADGLFDIKNVPEGTYAIRASKKGYAEMRRELSVPAFANAVLNATLEALPAN